MSILLIDYRENSFINLLKLSKPNKDASNITEESIELINELQLGQIYSCEINNVLLKFKICNLPIGDFIIKNSLDEENNFEKIQLIIERKTYSDLSASIIDGRFREQKNRIDEAIQNKDQILYILEGQTNCNLKRGINNVTLNSAIINLIYKHHYKVLHTNTLEDTLNSIILIYKKIINNEINLSNVSNESNNISLVTPLKTKGNKIKETLFATQLSVIPGISYKTALVISNHYKNINELINFYNNSQEIDKNILLADIQINDKRKIGKALSKKIYEALFN
jgi:crossover junction endonuclease MUS81